MKMKIIILLITISSAILLQSCGRKGPLYLPESEQSEQSSDTTSEVNR